MSELLYRIAERREGDGLAPVLLLLHGYGANDMDLLGLASYLDPRLTIVSPRAPIDIGYGGYSWYQMNQGTGTDDGSLRNALDAVGALIDALPEKHGTDPNRLFVGGFSQGAVLSSSLLLEGPSRFKGVVLLSGATPSIAMLQPQDITGKPVFVCHGRTDQVIQFDRGEALKDEMVSRGADVEWHEYGYTHEISLDTINDLNKWLDRHI